MMRTRSKVSLVLASSPARVENLAAPPLSRMRRRRSSSFSSAAGARSSPLLMADLREGREEPSSPKVTCIGQVRIAKRSSQRSNRAMKLTLGKMIAFRKLKRLLQRPACCRRKLELRLLDNEEEEEEQEEEEEDRTVSPEKEREKGEVFSSSTPPKNALLLMRCRTAPIRAAAAAAAAAALTAAPAAEEEKAVESSSRLVVLTRSRSEPGRMTSQMTALEAHNCSWKAAIASRAAAPPPPLCSF
ncbi:protamine P1 family protein [Wolffia australiana]